MKIGVLTWYYGANYGAKAQAYALAQILSKMGHSVQMLNFKTVGYEKLNISTNLNVEHAKHHPILYLKCHLRVRRFQKFNRHFKETSSVKSGEEIDNLNLDYVILGSDAIFNVKHKLFNKIYMGVGINKTKKIAYAPSCEDLSPDFKLKAEYVDSLKHFFNISVRDVNTKRLLKNNTGLDASIVADPTLLYSFRDIASTWNESNYILIYTFSDWSVYQEQIKSYADKKGLEIVSVGRYCRWADKSYTAASFEKWVCSFRRASYVFTDSFHGTVFALKNNKQIVLCSRPDKSAKIESLLRAVGIQERFYSGNESVDEYLQNAVIDYSEVNNRMKELVDNSLEYLTNSIV